VQVVGNVLVCCDAKPATPDTLYWSLHRPDGSFLASGAQPRTGDTNVVFPAAVLPDTFFVVMNCGYGLYMHHVPPLAHYHPRLR